jgi:hypothetical protein
VTAALIAAQAAFAVTAAAATVAAFRFTARRLRTWRARDRQPTAQVPLTDARLRALAWAVWFAAAALAAGMVLSYSALFEIADGAGVWPSYLTWMFPLTGDLLAGVAYAALMVLESGSLGRRYAGFVLVVSLAMSAGVQAIHANDVDFDTLDWRVRALVGAWPILAAGLSGHLVWLALESLRGRWTAPAVAGPAGDVEPEPDLDQLVAEAVERALPAVLDRFAGTAADTARQSTEAAAGRLLEQVEAATAGQLAAHAERVQFQLSEHYRRVQEGVEQSLRRFRTEAAQVAPRPPAAPRNGSNGSGDKQPPAWIRRIMAEQNVGKSTAYTRFNALSDLEQEQLRESAPLWELEREREEVAAR